MPRKATDNFIVRQKKLAVALKKNGHDAFLITSLINIRYLCGFKCSFGRLLAAGGKCYLLLDSRYTAAARRSASGVEVVQITASGINTVVRDLLGSHKLNRVAFEKEAVTHGEYLAMRRATKGMTLVPTAGIVEGLRLIKDESEIVAIRRACSLGDRAFKFIRGRIRIGMTEKQVASELDSYMVGLGIDGLAFETIAASGPRGAFPHAVPSARKLCSGDLLTLDFGVCLNGYNSDMTRTVAIGKPSPRVAAMYSAVQQAQIAACRAARQGMLASALDDVARTELLAVRLDKYFTHSLGHGLGLEVHEAPRVGEYSSEVLKRNMVFTIEPGVYVEGLGGVRIEDTVALTADGLQILTRSPKKLIVI